MSEFVEGRPSAPGGRCYAWLGTMSAGVEMFSSYGPLPGGRVLSRLYWWFTPVSGVGQQWEWAFVVSRSPDATAENFRAGESLVRGAGSRVAGQCAYTVWLSARGRLFHEMFPGVELRGGSAWLLVGVTANVSTQFSFSASLEFVWPGYYGGQFAWARPVPEAGE